MRIMTAIQDIVESTKPDVKWEDFAGLEKVKDVLKEVTVTPGKLCRGILLFGAPGTGKSLLVNAAVTDAKNSNFMSISAYSLRSDREVKALFGLARDRSPCIVYVDDVDAVCDPDGSGRVSDSLDRAKAEFITELGGLEPNNGVLVIAASNKPWRVHADLIKAFGRRVYIPLPDAAARTLIFQKQIRSEESMVRITADDIRILSKQTDGYTGADITIIVRDALMQPVRRLQAATHFKRVKNSLKKETDDLLTPCSPDSPGAVEMDWTQVPSDKLFGPIVEMTDFLNSLRTQKPTVTQSELKGYKDLAQMYETQL